MTNDRRNFLKRFSLAGAAFCATQNLKAQNKNEATQEYLSEAETDIVIVGAGPGGIPAAIAAARMGAKVVLIEEDQLIGGAPVDMYVSYVCGGPYVGIYKEILDELSEKGDISLLKEKKINGVWYIPSMFASVLADFVSREKNITLITGAPVTGVIMDKSAATPKILGVEYQDNYFQKSCVRAKITIDATGTGLVSALAGAKCLCGRESKADFGERLALDKADKKVQLCTIMAYAQRFKDAAPLDFSKTDFKALVSESGCGTFMARTDKADRTSYQFLLWSAYAPCDDTLRPTALGKTLIDTINKSVFKLAGQLMKQGYVLNIAPKLGVRECRRIVGKKIITGEDLMSGKYPEDVIALGDSGFDMVGRNKELGEIGRKAMDYGLPYAAALVDGIDNLLTSGKHISGTSLAMSAYRLQSILANFAQGVGTAAALAALSNTLPQNIDIKALQKILAQNGALPSQYA